MARLISKHTNPDVFKIKRRMQRKQKAKWLILYVSLLGNVILSYPHWEKYISVHLITSIFNNYIKG